MGSPGYRIPLLAALAALLLASGCGPGRQDLRATLQINRLGWDSLRVEARFAAKPWLGAYEDVAPQAFSLTVFDAGYDTLYTGAGPVVPIPDAALGDREQVVVEACGRVQGRSLCEQEVVTASPKRVRVEHDIRFPEDSDFARGSYDLRFIVERRPFDGVGWEPIEATDEVQAYLLAYVGENPREAVSVPVAAGAGRFDLARHANHRDFEYDLQTQLFEHREALVSFDVYGGLGGPPARLASVEKRVRLKTTEDRAAEVEHFVQEAARQVLDRLQVYRQAYVYIDRWEFDERANRYVVALEVQWRSGFFGRSVLEGELEVGEDGRGAQFRYEDGSRDVRARWEDEIRDRLLRLGALQVPAEPGAAAGDAAAKGADAERPEEAWNAH